MQQKSRFVISLLAASAVVWIPNAFSDQQHPVDLVGRWESEADGTLLVLKSTGVAKQFVQSREVVPSNGYWQQDEPGVLTLKFERQAVQKLRYALEHDVLRVTDSDGDTRVWRKGAGVARESIVGEWFHLVRRRLPETALDPRAWIVSDSQILLLDDGTYEVRGDDLPETVGLQGQWAWDDRGAIETHADPGNQRASWKVWFSAGELKLASKAGLLLRFVDSRRRDQLLLQGEFLSRLEGVSQSLQSASDPDSNRMESHIRGIEEALSGLRSVTAKFGDLSAEDRVVVQEIVSRAAPMIKQGIAMVKAAGSDAGRPWLSEYARAAEGAAAEWHAVSEALSSLKAREKD